jgi:hypothetical protein
MLYCFFYFILAFNIQKTYGVSHPNQTQLLVLLYASAAFSYFGFALFYNFLIIYVDPNKTIFKEVSLAGAWQY